MEEGIIIDNESQRITGVSDRRWFLERIAFCVIRFTTIGRLSTKYVVTKMIVFYVGKSIRNNDR